MSTKTKTNHLSPKTERLTEVLGTRHPDCCQYCSQKFPRERMSIWQEHDHEDKPEGRAVLLCDRCSARVIEPHPRLYSNKGINWPFPGLTPVCVGCVHREATGHCKAAKINGGPGVEMKYEPPIRGFIDGAKYSGPFTTYPKPATGCDMREPAA